MQWLYEEKLRDVIVNEQYVFTNLQKKAFLVLAEGIVSLRNNCSAGPNRYWRAGSKNKVSVLVPAETFTL